MMRRRETVLVILTLVAVGAGVVAGMIASRLPAAGAAAPTQSTLAKELNLSPQQSEQMRAIWEGVRGNVRKSYEDADRLGHQRDQAVQNMLNPEQKAAFEKLTRDYADQFAALRKQRDAAFADAVAQTRK